MKKIVAMILMIFVLISVSSCDLNAAYDDDARIAKTGDSNSTSGTRSSIRNTYKQTGKITGTRTIWRYNANSDAEITISYLLSVTEGGKAKLVLISPDDEVIVLAENADNTVNTEMQTQTVSIKKGLNRIKIVGYEAPRLELELHVDAGTVVTN